MYVSAYMCVCMCLHICMCVYVCIYVCIYMLFQKGPEFNLPLAPLTLTSMLLGYLGVWEEGD